VDQTPWVVGESCGLSCFNLQFSDFVGSSLKLLMGWLRLHAALEALPAARNIAPHTEPLKSTLALSIGQFSS
jgi:hypothetical protein